MCMRHLLCDNTCISSTRIQEVAKSDLQNTHRILIVWQLTALSMLLKKLDPPPPQLKVAKFQ